jgi:dipeptidyl aminopeptidase/acylaminoacyl peptidase
MLFSCRSFRCAPSLLVLCAALIALVHAQPDGAQSAASVPPANAPSRVQLDDILASQSRARTIAQVAVSPDGKRIAWLEASQIHVAPFDNLSQSQPVTAAAPGHSCNASDLVWSPDSASLVFLSDCPDPSDPSNPNDQTGLLGQQSDIYLSHLDGSPAHRLTELHGYVAAPVFSPDGQSVAFLYVEGATRPSGALAAESLPSGVIGEDHVEIQRVAVVTIPPNWNGELEPIPADNRPQGSRVLNHLIPLFSFLTPPNLHVFEFDWSPDSKSLAYVAADPPGENNWWVAKLYTQPVAVAAIARPPGAPGPGFPRTGPGPGGGDPESGSWDSTTSKPSAILAPSDISGPLHGLQIALPRWSPDGKSIAFIGGLMSDQGVVGGDVWVTSADVNRAYACGQLFNSGDQPPACGPLIDLTPNRPASANWIAWDGNDAVYISELAGGDSRLVRLRVTHNSAAPAAFDPPVFTIPGEVGIGSFDTSLSASADRSLFVFQTSTFNKPPEIYAARTKLDPSVHSEATAVLSQLSHFNDAVKPSWGDSVSLSWKNHNFNIQGWLLLPKDYNPAKKYPLLVEVHGGPASSVLSSWNGGAGGISTTTFSALGYFVLMPNPRGSYGQGEAFTQANRKDFGYGDLRDILAGVDTVLAKYPVDPKRIGIAGWSYGGFMTMFAITQTHRFRAAVAGAGISDWLSYYGENSIDQWMIPYFGASVYDDPAIYAKSSAITYIKQANTPSLVLVGDRDGECPAPQSFEFWHALRDLHVPAQLVVYPDEGHGFSDPADRRDVLERAVDWFAQYMPPSQ